MPLPCRAPNGGEAALHRAGDPLTERTYDRIALADGQSFYVIYSLRSADDGTAPCSPGPKGSPENSSCIYVLPLEPTDAEPPIQGALVFGAGYGDWCLATHGAACDAQQLDHVLRTELGFAPETTDLRFLAPHGHLDHINPAFLEAVAGLGYRWQEIALHAADLRLDYRAGPSVDDMPWSADLRKRFVLLEEAGDWPPPYRPLRSSLGELRLEHRPGHTPGSLDLILETPTQTIALRGSLHTEHDPRFDLDVKAHGNAIVSRPDDSRR